MAFSITPRLNDELFSLADELSRPWDYNYPYSRSPAVWMRNPVAGPRESEVSNTDKEFRIRLDLGHYKPEEVKITSNDDRVTISAKHEERQDDRCGHSFVSRQVTRSYKLPEDVDPRSVTSTMNSHGVLSIKAVKHAIEGPKDTPIPIEFTKK